MWIEIIKEWGHHRVGERYNFGGGIADMLIRRKFVKIVEDEPKKKKTRSKRRRLGTNAVESHDRTD